MHSTLLRAKLHRPASTVGAIGRPRLIDRLQAGLACKVTLVSAAAGFGKSTLLSAWLARLDAPAATQQSADPTTAGWLTLDRGDDDLPRFLRYLVAALEESFPHLCDPLTALLCERQDATVELMADTLVSCLAQLPGRYVLVLDDLHTLDDAAIYALLARLVQFAPPSFHLALSARVDPLQLPLNRWRAQNWLCELRQRELCFTREEVAAFLAETLPKPPSAATVAALHRYTEGWPVGLRLTTLALRGHADPAAFLATRAADGNRFVLDYLRDDVLEQQPAAVQSFLLGTAILKRFCPALCAAVLQIDEADAQRTLQAIERANMFLVDLSSPAQWYRYHHQFQSMLLARLHAQTDQQALAGLYRRAAEWLGANDEIAEALGYLIAVDDVPAAADLLERYRAGLVSAGRIQDLSDALALIPQAVQSQRPLLLLGGAWLDSWRLDWRAAAAKLQRAEQLLGDGEGRAGWSSAMGERVAPELVALRCVMDFQLEGKVTLAEIRAAWERARPHLAELPVPVVSALAEQAQMLGDYELCFAIFDGALRQSDSWPFRARYELLSRRATMLFYQAELSAAEHALRTNLSIAEQHGFASDVALAQLTLGNIAAARHQLGECERCLRAVLAELTVDSAKWAMMACSRLVEVYAYQRRLDEARLLLEQLKAFSRSLGLPYLHEHTAAIEAYLAVQFGDASTALSWVLQGLNQGPVYHPVDRLAIIRARILVAEGSAASMQAALPILAAYVRHMERHHLTFYLVEGMSLHALALAGVGAMDEALARLHQAVQLGVPHGIVGRFLERGRPMQRLLLALCNHPTYAAETAQARLLLAAFPSADATLSARAVGEALSERECDVLRLLAEGLSNKAIGQRLMISAHTVRNHTANIFAKLQVENRLQAVERARALGLLSRVVHR